MKQSLMTSIIASFLIAGCTSEPPTQTIIVIDKNTKIDSTSDNPPSEKWVSKSSNDSTVIQFNSPSSISAIIVTVDNDSPAGIDVKNCGSMTHLRKGESASCIIKPGISSPLLFNSDTAGTKASGTYVLR
jgi:hypothetical protein